MPFRVSRIAAVALLWLVVGCGMRVSLGDDDGEASNDASATTEYDVFMSPDAYVELDASVDDEPFEADTDASFEDVEAPDGDAALD